MPDRIAPISDSSAVRVATRFFPLSPALAPYVTAIYLTEVTAPLGHRIDDYLHPEWANLRFVEGEAAFGGIVGDDAVPLPRFIVTGPTSKAGHFSAGNMRAWGIGLLPMGWAKFVPLAAAELADRFCDGAAYPAFAAFAPLAERIYGANDADIAAQAIDAHLVAMLDGAAPDDPAILAAHQALIDEELASVAHLAARLSLSERSIERLSLRAFGFPPKLLLRRQRFLRSLARFMLDPSMAWIDTLDHHYYDQAQFTRDFQRFMGMSPRAYAARPKPILGAAALARAAAAGAAMQGLHKPVG